MKRLRRLAYRWGLRPRPGTLLFSPSLALEYGLRDAWAPCTKERHHVWTYTGPTGTGWRIATCTRCGEKDLA